MADVNDAPAPPYCVSSSIAIKPLSNRPRMMSLSMAAAASIACTRGLIFSLAKRRTSEPAARPTRLSKTKKKKRQPQHTQTRTELTKFLLFFREAVETRRRGTCTENTHKVEFSVDKKKLLCACAQRRQHSLTHRCYPTWTSTPRTETHTQQHRDAKPHSTEIVATTTSSFSNFDFVFVSLEL